MSSELLRALSILTSPVQESTAKDFKLALNDIGEDDWQNALAVAPFIIGNASCASISREFFRDKFKISENIVPFGLADSVIMNFWSCLSRITMISPEFSKKMPITTSLFPKTASHETISKLWYYKHYLVDYIHSLSDIEVAKLGPQLVSEADPEVLNWVFPLLVERQRDLVGCLIDQCMRNSSVFVDTLAVCIASYQCPNLSEKILVRLCDLILTLQKSSTEASLFAAFKCYLICHGWNLNPNDSVGDIFKQLEFMPSKLINRVIDSPLIPKVASMPTDLATLLETERSILENGSYDFDKLMDANPSYLASSLYILAASEPIQSTAKLLKHFKKMVQCVISEIKIRNLNPDVIYSECSLRDCLEDSNLTAEKLRDVIELAITQRIDVSSFVFNEVTNNPVKKINYEQFMMTGGRMFDVVSKEEEEEEEDAFDEYRFTMTGFEHFRRKK